MDATEYINNHWNPYEVWHVLQSPRHQKRLATCAAHLPLPPATYADIGCANGHSTAIMASHVGGLRRWTGVDFANTVRAVEHNFPTLQAIHVPSIAQLSTLVIAHDGVVCSEVIEHVEDDQLLVDQLMAITRKVLVITTPCRHIVDPGHLRVYTENQLRALCPDGHIEQEERFFYLTWRRET